MTDIAAKPRWDIFCKIVDNFGDIGVCWRLARQLQAEHGLQITLWIDDLAAAKAIIGQLDCSKTTQIVDEITINSLACSPVPMRLAEHAPNVVIEAFACGLPPEYIAQLTPKTVWINLEYLSAESWVDDFHGKPSPQANGLIRHFYFPGFTEKTGGLIRSPFDYAQDERLNIPVRPEPVEGDERVLKISLFCYPNAPIKDLFSALQASIHKVCVYVPATSILPKIAEYFGKDTIKAGEILSQNNLTVKVLPFLSQANYDQLLRDCDLNFVRGEDSWLRAIWAGRPFIWQPYIQDDHAHITKLNAFLDLFYANCEQKDLPCKAHGYWSAGQMPKDVLNNYLSRLIAIETYTQQQSAQLAKQTDLATKLLAFCNKA